MRTLKPRVAPLDLRRVQPLTIRDQRNLSSAAWQRTRLRILREANGTCQCQECKSTGRLRPAHEVDHIVPVWEGGGEDDANLQAINRQCHKAKTADEAKRRGGGIQSLALSSDRPPAPPRAD
ncbi:MAG: HNH endonuclease signature motif containing protein [Pseudomonadota bacterium]